MAENFKVWLLRQIKAHDWTYEALGELVGVSHGAVGGWVRGKYLPDPTSLRQLAKVTQVKDTWLFRLVGYLEPEAEERQSDPQIDGLIEKIMRLPPDDRLELGEIADVKLKRLRKG